MSEFRSPGKRNTCGLVRGTNLFRGTAALYDVQFVMLRLFSQIHNWITVVTRSKGNAAVLILCAILSSLASIGSSQQKLHLRSESANSVNSRHQVQLRSGQPRLTPSLTLETVSQLGPHMDMKSSSASLICGPPWCPANNSSLITVPHTMSCTSSTVPQTISPK